MAQHERLPDSTPGDIESALELFDSEYRDTPEIQGWEADKRHFYVLEHNGKRYPPKYIVSLATGLSRQKFGGGRNSGYANPYLEKLGFKIVQIRWRNPL